MDHQSLRVLVLAIFCIFAASTFQSADAAKILCAFPTPSRAQMVVAGPLFEGLALRGHQVTVLSSFPREKPLKNYRDVTVKVDHLLEGKPLISHCHCHCRNLPFISMSPPSAQLKSLTKSAGVADSFLSTFSTMTHTGLEAANMSMNSKQFRKIMDTESFDLVIVGLFANNFLVGKFPIRLYCK